MRHYKFTNDQYCKRQQHTYKIFFHVSDLLMKTRIELKGKMEQSVKTKFTSVTSHKHAEFDKHAYMKY